jgi:pimeloyl-ACP methyl ester carboxylesterase
VMASGFGPRWTPELEAVCRANDLDALAALASAQWPSVEDILPTVTVPCLIFVGEDDSSYAGAKRAAEIMPNATFVGLPGLDHICHLSDDTGPWAFAQDGPVVFTQTGPLVFGQGGPRRW